MLFKLTSSCAGDSIGAARTAAINTDSEKIIRITGIVLSKTIFIQCCADIQSKT